MLNVIFWSSLALLLALTIAIPAYRRRALSRKGEDWWIDLVSLAIHLWGLPVIQVAVLWKILDWVMPSFHARYTIGPIGALLLYVLLDYLWYWNHRLLHSYTWIWNLHAVHHSATQVDFFTTARNSIWSHAFEVYMWFIALTLYVARDPAWFAAYMVIGSILNFWSHTEVTFSRDSRAYRWISKVLITPHEHLWHHSTTHAATNFSTVFSLWDRIHGTLHAPVELPESYGNEYLPGAVSQLFLPVPPLMKPSSGS